MEVKYNFQRLQGRIKEYYGTQNNFAKELGVTKQCLSRKLQNKSKFGYDEVTFMINKLHIRPNEVQDIFFTKEC